MRERFLVVLMLLMLVGIGCTPSEPQSTPMDSEPASSKTVGPTEMLEPKTLTLDASVEPGEIVNDDRSQTETPDQESVANKQADATAEPADKDDAEQETSPTEGLPDSKLSDAASDLSAEPVYVDPRKHDPVFPPKDNWRKLAKDYPIWIDLENKQVIVDGRIAQIQAALEMFACPVDSGKEHESVVGLYAQSELIHAALLAVGAKPGHPVIFQPEFKPPTGTKVPITAEWEIDGERKSIDAKKWIRTMDEKKTLEMDWVFGGSQIYTDDRTGDKHYLANGGETVCVSNFSTAMLDLPIKSSADAANQIYEANTEEIPPLGTPVRLIFKPVIEAETDEADQQDDSQAETSPEDKQSDEGDQ